MSTVDANTGNFESFTEVETSVVDIPYSVVASASIPVIFPPQKYFSGKVHIDGGTAYGVDVVSAVARCREIVDDDSKIILDVIVVTVIVVVVIVIVVIVIVIIVIVNTCTSANKDSTKRQ